MIGIDPVYLLLRARERIGDPAEESLGERFAQEQLESVDASRAGVVEKDGHRLAADDLGRVRAHDEIGELLVEPLDAEEDAGQRPQLASGSDLEGDSAAEY